MLRRSTCPLISLVVRRLVFGMVISLTNAEGFEDATIRFSRQTNVMRVA
jgi:hypothetical protein